jgi:hypothetical protein
MAATAAAEHVRFADSFPLFNPQGDLQREVETLCALLLLCTQNDSHPSDVGYQVLGDLVWNVSGYGVTSLSAATMSRSGGIVNMEEDHKMPTSGGTPDSYGARVPRPAASTCRAGRGRRSRGCQRLAPA